MKEVRRLKWLIYICRLAGNYKQSEIFIKDLQIFLKGKFARRNYVGKSTWCLEIERVQVSYDFSKDFPVKIYVYFLGNPHRYDLNEIVLED